MGEPEDWELFTSFSAVPRHTGKAMADLTDQEKAEADAQRAGWKPGNWRVDDLGRVYLLLCYAEQGKEKFLDRLEKIDRKSTRLNSSHVAISYAVFCLKKKK